MDSYQVFVIGWGAVCVGVVPLVIYIIVDALRKKA